MPDLANLESVPSDGGHLTAEQVSEIECYVDVLLKNLDLAHWRVEVGDDLPPEGASLSIFPIDGRRFATLEVCASWWAATTPAEKRRDLTHEVLHLAHHDAEEGVRRFFNYSPDVSPAVTELVLREFKTNLERMVDSLSYAIAPLMPKWIDPIV